MDKAYIQTQRQEIQNKFNKAQQKWIGMCEMAGKEYLSLQERIVELNKELEVLAQQEKALEAPKPEAVKNKK